MPIETFNISFESTRNKQQYGSKITSTELKKKGGGGGGEVTVIRNVVKLVLSVPCF